MPFSKSSESQLTKNKQTKRKQKQKKKKCTDKSEPFFNFYFNDDFYSKVTK